MQKRNNEIVRTVVFYTALAVSFYEMEDDGGNDMAKAINKEMIIADMLQVDPGIAAILMASGMHCIGCPSAQGESLEEAALVHGLDADELVKDVNEYLEKKEA